MDLQIAINTPFTESEIELKNSINRMSQNLYNKFAFEKGHNFYNKKGDKYGIEYGYDMSLMGNITIFMLRTGIKNICDLGCGLGLGLYPVQFYGINVYGFDNEQYILDDAHCIFGKELFKNKDITKLVKEDILDNSLIYFYEPIYERNLCKLFIDNLCFIINKNQLVYCRNTSKHVGFSFELLNERTDMEFISLDKITSGALYRKI